MSSLFGKRKVGKRKRHEETETAVEMVAKSAAETHTTSSSDPWLALGLNEWISKSCRSMGLRVPTVVQKGCIPAILQGKDVIGCAPTGSGKTAAFALPIMKRLSDDPFGIFAVVLTPTRELGIQIAEQFQALGSPIGLRNCVIIGGMDMLTQSLALQKRPHVVIATPGRLSDHLRGANPPELKRTPFLVLDEADRLLTSSFVGDLQVIIETMSGRKQTLLFSATMSKSTQQLQLIVDNAYKFDATPSVTTVERLKQYYLFMPLQVKACYLAHVLATKGPYANDEEESEEEDESYLNSQQKRTSAIVFTSTCKSCQTLAVMLQELNIPCVALHSMMTQHRRLAALGKFKSSQVRTLICTDVASRGLDIPSVELVLNYDIPRLAADYIHRVGRTARAGRGGRAVSLVSQYDVSLLQHIEKEIGKEMELLDDVEEEEVLKGLHKTSDAMTTAKLKLEEWGFDEKLEQRKKRKGKK